MPIIKSSTQLRNNYNDISTLCHKYREPVFITKNGEGDLAVMSIESFEEMKARYELYTLLDEGLQDVKEGRVRPYKEAMADIRKEFDLD